MVGVTSIQGSSVCGTAFISYLALCTFGVAATFLPGDVLVINAPGVKTTLAGYSQTGTYRGSVDLTNTGGKGYVLFSIKGLSVSPDGLYTFFEGQYYERAHPGKPNRFKLVVVATQSKKVVAVLSVPFPGSCVASYMGYVAAPGGTAGTYTLYASVTCFDLVYANKLGAVAFVYNVKRRTIKLYQKIFNRRGADGNELAFGGLFTIGASLYAKTLGGSHDNQFGLVRVDPTNGMVTPELSVTVATGVSCTSETIASATSLYAICFQEQTGPSAPPPPKITFFSKGKAAKTIILPVKGKQDFMTLASPPSSPYLTVLSTPHSGGGKKITITTLVKPTGKAAHTFTKDYNGFPLVLAVVPPRKA